MDEPHWTETALQDLDDIAAYIAFDSPRSADKLIRRILQAVGLLTFQPRMGREIVELGVRRLTIGGTPYVAIYRLRERVEILTIFHTSRQWPDDLPLTE